MANTSTKKSSRRGRLARIFLTKTSAQDRISGHDGIGWPELLMGIGFTVVISVLLVEFQFQSIPDYKIGDIADRTIEAPHEFVVEDEEATRESRLETRNSLPIIFDLDMGVNHQVEAELREGFSEARKVIAEVEGESSTKNVGRLLDQKQQKLLLSLKENLPRFDQGDILEICFKYAFSEQLEDQLVELIKEVMKPPGVVLTRDVLFAHQGRGVVLRNTVTGQDRAVNDWMAIRDLTQARDALRQNEYQLTLIAREEKRQIIAFLDGWVVPNVYHNKSATRALESLALSEVESSLIHIKKGRILVRAGDEIQAREMAFVGQLKRLKQPSRIFGKFIGILLLVGFFISVLWYYFFFYQKHPKGIVGRCLLTALVLVLTLLTAKTFFFLADILSGHLNVEGFQNSLNFYFLTPLATGAILLVLLVNIEVALLYSIIFAVFIGFMKWEMEMFVYCLTSSLAAIHLMRHHGDRATVIKGGLILGVVNVVAVLSLLLYSSELSFHWLGFAIRVLGASLSGLCAVMLAFLLLPILENLFRITTDIRLLELSNLNNPVLRRLAVEAPGTYHHSIIVGTLAESAAEAIKANSLLVRVGAYYHDIGKLKKPEYYVENQIFAPNKHESLAPSMSSLILVNHVKDGLAMAEELKLAPKVRDLIPQHHGTKLMTYFYQKAKEANNGKEREVDERDFRYPGPKPQSKEAAILMLADQVGAASRTLQNPSPSQIRGLIRRLIQSTIQDRQFDECDVTMRDLDKIIGAFERAIIGMHHHRIEYPGFEFNEKVEDKSDSQRV